MSADAPGLGWPSHCQARLRARSLFCPHSELQVHRGSHASRRAACPRLRPRGADGGGESRWHSDDLGSTGRTSAKSLMWRDWHLEESLGDCIPRALLQTRAPFTEPGPPHLGQSHPSSPGSWSPASRHRSVPTTEVPRAQLGARVFTPTLTGDVGAGSAAPALSVL